MVETLLDPSWFRRCGGIFSGAEVPGAGRKFVRRLLRAKKKNLSALKEFIEERRARYTRKAKREIVSSTRDRDLTRLHGKFATIYAAGALAIEYEILPFKRRDLLAAILKCEADHVCLREKP
jgi:putative DNA primase/helicase